MNKESHEQPSLREKTDTEKQFKVRNPEKKIKTGGFGNSSSTKKNQKSNSESGDSTVSSTLNAIDIQHYISKESTLGEQCLNVDDYANVIYEIFRSAKGEFCFGLFGNWGRGKTYLANNASKLFERVNNYSVIHFNAWKYRETPELWVHLYEAFYTKAKELGFLPALFISIRAGLVKYEFWQLVLNIALILFAFFPLSIKIDAVWKFINIAGIGSLFLLYRLFSTRKYFTKLKNMYGTLPSHREKLGLQATIGDDLRALIIGWIPNDFFIKKANYKAPLIVCIALFLIFLLILSIFLKPTSFKFDDKFFYYILYLLSYIFISFIFFITIYLSIVYSFKDVYINKKFISLFSWLPIKTKNNKILLIVDDLDRCEPEQLLNIIESLKLLLEDPEIHERVQMLFLVEENKLRFAIYGRFEGIINFDFSNIKEEDKFDKEIINEHIEKLITCYLRFPPITPNETDELIIKSLNYKPLNREDSKAESKNEVDLLEAERFERNNLGYYPKIIYNDDEVKIIAENSKKIKGWTPRKIRIFLFKYQLARLLSKKLSPDIGFDILAKTLIDEAIKRKKKDEILHLSDDPLARIIYHVI